MVKPDISPFIIAGGKSSRFGRDKSLFMYRGRPLVEHVIETVRGALGRVAIVADRADRFSYDNIPCYADIIPGLGPIGGLLTALRVADTGRVFVFACDMPELNPDLIVYMNGLSGGYDAVAPSLNGAYEPLHAIYTKNCIGPVEQSIKDGRLSVTRLLYELRVLPVTEEQIRKFVDPSLAFRNINYYADTDDGQGTPGEIS